MRIVTKTIYTLPLDNKQFIISLINNITGLDIESHNIISYKVHESPYPPPDLSGETSLSNVKHVEKSIKIVIAKGDNIIGVVAVFIDNYLDYCSVRVYKGSIPSENLTTREYIGIALEALEKYHKVFNVSYIKKMMSILHGLKQKEIQLPAIIDTPEIKLVMNKTGYPEKAFKIIFYRKILGQYTSRWLITQIEISTNGIITWFADSVLYKVATTTIKVTREKALDIAMSYITKYAEENNRKIKTVNITLNWVPDLSQKRGDIFEIYPIWNIEAYFYPPYRQGVVGCYVTIWADTGEIRSHGMIGYYMPPSELLGNTQETNKQTIEQQNTNTTNNKIQEESKPNTNTSTSEQISMPVIEETTRHNQETTTVEDKSKETSSKVINKAINELLLISFIVLLPISLMIVYRKIREYRRGLLVVILVIVIACSL